MKLRLFLWSALVMMLASSAMAQSHRVEIMPFIGYTLSEGIDVDPIAVGGDIITAVNPTSGFSYGVGFGVFATENVEIGFQWTRQDSTLDGEGTTSQVATFEKTVTVQATTAGAGR